MRDLSATGLLRGFAGVSRVFRRCFAGVSRIHESRFTCFAAVSQVFREIHDVKHVSRIRGDVSRIRGDSRVFRGCFADSRKKIHVFRGCFTAVSHVNMCSRPVALRSLHVDHSRKRSISHLASRWTSLIKRERRDWRRMTYHKTRRVSLSKRQGMARRGVARAVARA